MKITSDHDSTRLLFPVSCLIAGRLLTMWKGYAMGFFPFLNFSQLQQPYLKLLQHKNRSGVITAVMESFEILHVLTPGYLS